MFRDEVARCSVAVGALRMICKYQLSGEARDDALALLDEMEGIFLRPNGKTPEEQRAAWREQKRRKKEELSSVPRGNATEDTRNPSGFQGRTVVEEEEEGEEEEGEGEGARATVPLDGVMDPSTPVVFDAEPIHDDLDIPPLDAKPPPRNGAGLAAQVAQVYDHWRSYHPQAAPRLPATAPEARKAKLAFAAGHTVESLAKSIDGYHRSPFHNGVNDRGTKYLSLGLILRDESHIVDGIAMADDPMLGRGMSEKERKGVHATQAWLARHGADTAPADPWRTPE